MPIKLNGAVSGYAQIQAASTAANNTLNLPSSGTTLLSDATLPTTTPTNGQIPIGNGTTYVPATITAGTGISVTNGSGSVTIATSGLVSGFANMQVFTSGTSTWTIPAGITACKITVVGGGGGGGAGAQASGCVQGGSGGGGGGGGTAIKYFTGLTPGNTLSYTVGAAGGTSSVSSGTQTIVTISATGGATGASGASTNSGAGGSGGLGSGGTLNLKGNGGGTGITAPIGGGYGAGSMLGGGGGSSTGGVYGGGGAGGGGGPNGSPGSAGSAGAAGVIIIEY